MYCRKVDTVDKQMGKMVQRFWDAYFVYFAYFFFFFLSFFTINHFSFSHRWKCKILIKSLLILILFSGLVFRAGFLQNSFRCLFCTTIEGFERFANLHQKEDLLLILSKFLRKGGWMGSWIGWVSNSQQPPRGETWKIIIIYYIIHNRILDTIINFIANNVELIGCARGFVDYFFIL